LFDGIAALIGIRSQINYEAQAAIELEAIADPNETGFYSFELSGSIKGSPTMTDQPIRIGSKPIFLGVIDDLRSGIPVEIISGKFHNSLVNLIVDLCQDAKRIHGLQEVALSGGVWQNMTLLNKTVQLLRKVGFDVYTHRQVPTNDGGLSLGQAAIAAHAYQK
jgi:hydrogenase maturation protein HypF